MTSISDTILDPFFAETSHGRRFAVANYSRKPSRGAILFIPPFAEEMNKSRRMAALSARALAEDGWYALRFDLFGCGDSEGEFAETTWNDWIADVAFWADWLRSRSEGPTILLGLRAGALLAAALLEQTNTSLPLLLWQPVTNGQQHLTQFLRLRAAAEMLDARQARGTVAALKGELAAGTPITVAGYTLRPELANPLAASRLTPPDNYKGTMSVMEILPNADASPSPGLSKLIQTWRNAGISARLTNVAGAAFWRTVEIETIPELIHATVREVRQLAT